MSDGSAKETGLAIPTGLEQATSRLIPPIEVPTVGGRRQIPIKVWSNAAYFQPNPDQPIYYAAYLFQELDEGDFRFITAPVTLSGNPDDDRKLLGEMAAQGIDTQQVKANCSEQNIRKNFGVMGSYAAESFLDIRRMTQTGAFVTNGVINDRGDEAYSGWDPIEGSLNLVGQPYDDKAQGYTRSPFFMGSTTKLGISYGRQGLTPISDPIEPTTKDPISKAIIGKVLKANLAKK